MTHFYILIKAYEIAADMQKSDAIIGGRSGVMDGCHNVKGEEAEKDRRSGRRKG
jgi:hypothetical protein